MRNDSIIRLSVFITKYLKVTFETKASPLFN